MILGKTFFQNPPLSLSADSNQYWATYQQQQICQNCNIAATCQQYISGNYQIGSDCYHGISATSPEFDNPLYPSAYGTGAFGENFDRLGQWTGGYNDITGVDEHGGGNYPANNHWLHGNANVHSGMNSHLNDPNSYQGNHNSDNHHNHNHNHRNNENHNHFNHHHANDHHHGGNSKGHGHGSGSMNMNQNGNMQGTFNNYMNQNGNNFVNSQNFNNNPQNLQNSNSQNSNSFTSLFGVNERPDPNEQPQITNNAQTTGMANEEYQIQLTNDMFSNQPIGGVLR